ncbi:hypothetical protein K0M31_008675 [Melipona bicolor]|uniref:Uncharacterized protein n=1 Tax=Melipona bicolor TaxID=60889 RepID=A0AA40FPM6_9HYME|nr:hypothetical protein K0M31_008675 [Melipona bicolor]
MQHSISNPKDTRKECMRYLMGYGNREPFRPPWWYHDDSTLLPRKSVVLGAKYILFLSVPRLASLGPGYAGLVCGPVSAMDFQNGLSELFVENVTYQRGIFRGGLRDTVLCTFH